MNISINKINGLLGHYTGSKYRGIMPIPQQKHPKALNNNPKSLNSNLQMRVTMYIYQSNPAIKNGFQNLKLKRSFSKMPFFKMPYYTMIIYILTYCRIYAIIV